MHSQGFATRNSAGAHKRLISTPRPPLKSLAAIKGLPASSSSWAFAGQRCAALAALCPTDPNDVALTHPTTALEGGGLPFGLRASIQSKHQALSSTNISTSTNTSASTSSTSTIRAPASNQLFCARFNGTARSDRKIERLSVPLLAQTLSRFHYHSTNQRDNHGTTRWPDFRFDRS
jgi:hypothetical protein